MSGYGFRGAAADIVQGAAALKGLKEQDLNNELLRSRLKNLETQTQLADLQRKDYELSEGYRRGREGLDLKLGEAQLATEASHQTTDKLHQALLESQTTQTKNQTQYAAEDRPVEARTKAAVAGRAESEALQSGLSTLGGMAQYLPDQTDVVPYIKMINPKASEADIAALTPVFSGMLEQAHTKLADDRQVVQEATNRNKQTALLNAMTAEGVKVTTLRAVSEFMAQAEDKEAALTAIIGAYPDRPELIAAAKAMATRQLSPEDKVLQTKLSEQLSVQLGILQQEKSTLAKLKGEDKDTTGVGQFARLVAPGATTQKSQIKAQQENVDREQAAYNDLRQQIKAVLNKKPEGKADESKSTPTENPDNLPVISSQVEWNKLPGKTRYWNGRLKKEGFKE